MQSRDSAVDIATGYGLDDLGLDFESRSGVDVALLHVVQTGSGTQSDSYLMGTGGYFLGSKAAGV
jgi:hypothetical protein